MGRQTLYKQQVPVISTPTYLVNIDKNPTLLNNRTLSTHLTKLKICTKLN